jgi:diguanylate cyclase (GGDEF)-like protein
MSVQLPFVVDGISHFAWLARPDGSIEHVNRLVRDYVGDCCWAGAPWGSWVHPEDDAKARQAWDQAVATETTFQLDCRLRRADGCFRWHAITAQPVRNGDVVTWLGIAIDTHDARSLEAELKKAQLSSAEALALLSTLQLNAPIGLGFVDRDFRQVFVNETLVAYAGLSDGNQIGRLVADMLPTLWPTLEPLYRHVLDTGESIVEVEVSSTTEDDPPRIRHWSNSYYPVVVEGQVTGVGVVALDVTERKQMQEELSHQALHDSLTGLANRALLTDRLQHSLSGMRRRGTQLGVIFLDLDDFKLVNDSLGHSAGDELLGQVAARLTGIIRHSDTIARFGGDEFVIICDDTSVEQTERTAERILEALREPYVIGNRQMNVTASVGIAMADGDSTPESLLRDSDSAMYLAKSRGRNRVGLFDEVVRAKNQVRLDTVSALRQALEHGELSVHYQPIIDVATGAMVSAEALLRWNHASRGPISPAEFIPLAEESGFMIPLGAWVLEQACAELVEWQRSAPGMSVSVNLPSNKSSPPTSSIGSRAFWIPPGSLRAACAWN